MPHKEVFDGVLIILGGALLLTPGFITDVLGLILLIPPTRAIVRAVASRRVRRRMAMGEAATMWTFGGRRRRPPRQRRTRAERPPLGAGTGGAGARRLPRPGPMPDDMFSWEEPPPPARGPMTSRGPGTRSATRTSCRPAGSPSADEGGHAFVRGFGDLARDRGGSRLEPAAAAPAP